MVGMKHATLKSLATIEDIPGAIRPHPQLTERKPGIFYRKSNAILHFHEDPAGLFADLKTVTGSGFERLPVNTAEERKTLLAASTHYSMPELATVHEPDA